MKRTSLVLIILMLLGVTSCSQVSSEDDKTIDVEVQKPTDEIIEDEYSLVRTYSSGNKSLTKDYDDYMLTVNLTVTDNKITALNIDKLTKYPMFKSEDGLLYNFVEGTDDIKSSYRLFSFEDRLIDSIEDALSVQDLVEGEDDEIISKLKPVTIHLSEKDQANIGYTSQIDLIEKRIIEDNTTRNININDGEITNVDKVVLNLENEIKLTQQLIDSTIEKDPVKLENLFGIYREDEVIVYSEMYDDFLQYKAYLNVNEHGRINNIEVSVINGEEENNELLSALVKRVSENQSIKSLELKDIDGQDVTVSEFVSSLKGEEIDVYLDGFEEKANRYVKLLNQAFSKLSILKLEDGTFQDYTDNLYTTVNIVDNEINAYLFNEYTLGEAQVLVDGENKDLYEFQKNILGEGTKYIQKTYYIYKSGNGYRYLNTDFSQGIEEHDTVEFKDEEESTVKLTNGLTSIQSTASDLVKEYNNSFIGNDPYIYDLKGDENLIRYYNSLLKTLNDSQSYLNKVENDRTLPDFEPIALSTILGNYLISNGAHYSHSTTMNEKGEFLIFDSYTDDYGFTYANINKLNSDLLNYDYSSLKVDDELNISEKGDLFRVKSNEAIIELLKDKSEFDIIGSKLAVLDDYEYKLSDEFDNDLDIIAFHSNFYDYNELFEEVILEGLREKIYQTADTAYKSLKRYTGDAFLISSLEQKYTFTINTYLGANISLDFDVTNFDKNYFDLDVEEVGFTKVITLSMDKDFEDTLLSEYKIEFSHKDFTETYTIPLKIQSLKDFSSRIISYYEDDFGLVEDEGVFNIYGKSEFTINPIYSSNNYLYDSVSPIYSAENGLRSYGFQLREYGTSKADISPSNTDIRTITFRDPLSLNNPKSIVTIREVEKQTGNIKQKSIDVEFKENDTNEPIEFVLRFYLNSYVLKGASESEQNIYDSSFQVGEPYIDYKFRLMPIDSIEEVVKDYFDTDNNITDAVNSSIYELYNLDDLKINGITLNQTGTYQNEDGERFNFTVIDTLTKSEFITNFNSKKTDIVAMTFDYLVGTSTRKGYVKMNYVDQTNPYYSFDFVDENDKEITEVNFGEKDIKLPDLGKVYKYLKVNTEAGPTYEQRGEDELYSLYQGKLGRMADLMLSSSFGIYNNRLYVNFNSKNATEAQLTLELVYDGNVLESSTKDIKTIVLGDTLLETRLLRFINEPNVDNLLFTSKLNQKFEDLYDKSEITLFMNIQVFDDLGYVVDQTDTLNTLLFDQLGHLLEEGERGTAKFTVTANYYTNTNELISAQTDIELEVVNDLPNWSK